MMQLKDLQNIIQSNMLWQKLSNKIVFLEGDPFLEKLIIGLLEQKMGCKARYALDYADISAQLETSGLFSSSNIYVIRDCAWLMKNPKEFLSARVSRDNVLVLIYSSISKDSVFFDMLKDDICWSPKLSLQQFEAAINSRYPLPAECCKAIAEVCNFDSERVFSELYKLSILAIATNMELKDVVIESINNGLVRRDEPGDILEMCDAAKSGNMGEALAALSKLSKSDADALKIVGIIHESCKGELATPPRIRKLTEAELASKMELAHSLEMGIKVGSIDEDIARDFVVIELSMRKGGASTNGELI